MTNKPVANTYEEQAKLIDPSRPVKCYRNLRTKKFSVMQDRIVRFHTNEINLTNVKFEVNAKIRERVRLTKQKQVHAFVCGTLDQPVDEKCFEQVYYNPYNVESFILLMSNIPIYSASRCELVKYDDGRMHVYVYRE